MEGVLVSAATGALKAVTVKLATLLGDEFKNMNDVRKEIKSLSDEQKNELINLLTEDGSSSQHLAKVVSIVGSGGLGKTTLANQVFESLKDTFDCHAFVTVSRTPRMMEVLRTILRDISGQEYTGDMQHLIKKISNFLQDKRYLVVVDDLWDSHSWETIQNAFIKNSCASRIITTTRKIEVAQSCCSLYWGHIYKLHPLDPKSSRKLLLKRIFGSEEGCPSDLSEVCEVILRKCDGLPLAIIAIAGLLAGKAPAVDEWNKVQRSFGHALERHSDVNRMIEILSLSYFDLRLHLRSCLLYLSVFPEDYEVQKDRLILRWIAEGFIHEEHGFTQYELGERCFNELINRSLIQPVFSNFFCRVHDTILEFILSKAVEENIVTLFGVPDIRVDPHRKIRRLSLHDKNEVSDALAGLWDNRTYYHARSVSVFPDSLDILPSLLKFRHVRVLDLQGCQGLQAHHLSGLFALRYLSLRDTGIGKLPEELGELQYLRTLDVRTDRTKELPSSVGRLARLVTLLCFPYVRLPDGFGNNMQALQWLGYINVSIQSPSFAQELRQLRNLRKLDLRIDDEFSEDLVSSLCTLGTGSLNSLFISGNKEQKKLVMDPWSPTPVGIKILRIWKIELPRVPRWIGSLDNLQVLTLFVEQLGMEDIGLLGSLNALSRLYLAVTIEVADSSSQGTQRIKISGAHGFPNLRRFQVGSRDCALGLLFEAGAMPKLQELYLEFDRDKTCSLTNGEFDFGIQHLWSLALVTCFPGYFTEARGREEYEPEHPAWDALKKVVSSHPKLRRLSYPCF